MTKKMKDMAEWAKYTYVASLSNIYDNTQDYLLMIQKLNITDDNNYVLGGKLLGTGLINLGKGMEEEKKAKMKEHLQLQNQSNSLKNGAIMNLGLSHFQTND